MYKIILAIRYLFKRRISWLAVAAVALCVFMVVVVMTVLSGLVIDFKNKNHNFVGDCIISTPSLVGFPYYGEFMSRLLKEADFVEAASPVVKSWALLTPAGSDKNVGVEIMGIEPHNHCRVTNFGEAVYYHKNDCARAFVPSYDSNLPGIIVGIEMMGGRDAYGKYIHTASPPNFQLVVSCFPLTIKGALAKAGTSLVNTKSFYFSDDVHTGLVTADNEQVYVPFDDLQMLCGMDVGEKRTSAIYMRFESGANLQQGRDTVAMLWRDFVAQKKDDKNAVLLANVKVQTWKEYCREIVAPMEKEQTMMTLLFCLIGIITVFIILVIFYMIITHKNKDIGILKSVGACNGDVLELFLGLAAFIGIIGSAVGGLAGIVFLANINNIEEWLFEHFGFQLWDRTIYAIDAIPNKLEPSVLAVILISAIAACLIGAFVPAAQAARKRPVETLQVNQL
jgi:ABC-type lipoprotein release transport system permease subunit